VSSKSGIGTGPSVLALWMTIDGVPTSAAAAPAIRCTASFSPTSNARPCASPPSSRISHTTASRSAAPRATSTTLAPRRASDLASSFPNPLDAPVTSAASFLMTMRG
jgi:hypothetical protein